MSYDIIFASNIFTLLMKGKTYKQVLAALDPTEKADNSSVIYLYVNNISIFFEKYSVPLFAVFDNNTECFYSIYNLDVLLCEVRAEFYATMNGGILMGFG